MQQRPCTQANPDNACKQMQESRRQNMPQESRHHAANKSQVTAGIMETAK